MGSSKPSVLLISSQPIQNSKPLQLLSQSSEIDMLVVFCSLPDQEMGGDMENINKHVFDIPILSGYKWVHPKNYSPFPSLYHAFGLINFGIIKLIKEYDCCIVFGHAFISFWIAILTAKLVSKPIILSTDATYLDPIKKSQWKSILKKYIFPLLYNKIANAVLVPSTASKNFLESLGVHKERIYITPYTVDNDYIREKAKKTNRDDVRKSWKIPKNASVVLFCGKFIPRKRPQDLIKAFAKASIKKSFLVMVGDGPLMSDLRREVQKLEISDRVKFLGFVSYSKLPEVYTSSDILAHPAEWEPYGLPVNEAMVCGIPVIVSDRVGAGYDLVENGKTGFIYPVKDIDKLSDLLKLSLSDNLLLDSMGKEAIKKVSNWSPKKNAEATLQAIYAVLNISHNSS